MPGLNPPDSLIHADHSVLLLIDIQGKLAPAIHQGSELIRVNERLVQVANELQVPVVYTEQYPKGLGVTVPQLAVHLENATVYEKIHFSAAKEPAFRDLMASMNRTQVVVTGTETHVCVLQTVLDLIELNYQVFVVANAVGSRAEANKNLALKRMAAAGAHVVSEEMVMFEWLERAGTDTFRSISKRFIV